MSRHTVASARVPATTANLGPGFDTLGIALNLYNTVTVLRASETAPAVTTKKKGATVAKAARLPASAGVELSGAMVQATADAYFRAAYVEPFAFSAAIKGDVPRSRGLGSSVTVRLGLSAALNLLAGEPLDRNGLLDLTTELEGHPDNAAPAVCGGFAACGSQAIVSVPVKPRLSFVVLIPELVLETKDARRVLPAKVTLADAVKNVQNTAVITAAFCSERYEVLRGAFQDTLHEPYRAELIPGFYDIISAAEDAGALGAFLSGAGSSIMALVLEDQQGVQTGAAQRVAEAMQTMASESGLKSTPLLLKADNVGVKVTGR
ncbi:MAG: homoserine kinase [Candidatus Methylacidiphilales bacterium]|nr:homoserine kinase [Candidatus Methylacidiphilales bacterium]